jgi:tetratricopeptide (TPR) repeat protein
MIILLLPVMLSSCALWHDAPREQQKRTPQGCYLLGLEYLEQGELQKAVDQFEMARSLDPDYAPAYEGMGRAALAEGDIQQAKQYFELGLQQDNTFAPLYVGKGRVLAAQERAEGAVDQFQQALKLEPQYADAYYYLAKAYIDLGLYSQAEESFKKTLDRDPSHVGASEDWEALARQRTPPDEPPQEYIHIVKKPLISRADWAALLAHQLPLQELCNQRDDSLSAYDISASWAAGEIQQVISCGLMPLNDAGEFQPEQKITRRGCAEVAARVLSLASGEVHLLGQFDGLESPYPDVGADHPGFGAIMLVTSREIMSAQADGGFAPDETVTGHRAIKIVAALKKAIE